VGNATAERDEADSPHGASIAQQKGAENRLIDSQADRASYDSELVGLFRTLSGNQKESR
jgi:hypothetical protein